MRTQVAARNLTCIEQRRRRRGEGVTNRGASLNILSMIGVIIQRIYKATGAMKVKGLGFRV